MPVLLPAMFAVHAPTAAQVARRLSAEARRCSGRLTLTGEGVGAVRVGASVQALRRACRLGKTRKGEASPSGVLALKIGRTPVQAETAQGRIWRVVVDGGGLRTIDRLGVGSPLSAVLAAGGPRASETEGVIYASTASNCGVSFALSYRPQPGEDRDNWTAEALARLPPDTRVERVLISGCKTSD